MNELQIADVPYEKINESYANQWELMEDLFSLVDYRLYLFYKYHQWLGPGNDLKNMLGLVISREEFEHKLTKSAQLGLYQRINASEREQIELSETAVTERLRLTTARIYLLELIERLALNEFERSCVILAYVAELDSKYERLFAYLQDDVTRKKPSISLAVQLYLPPDSTVEEYISFFDRENRFTSLFDREERAAGNLRLRPIVSEFLSGGSVIAPRGMAFFDGAAAKPAHPLVIRQETAAGLDLIMNGKRESVVLLTGPLGCGRRFQIQHLMSRIGEKCLFVDLAALNYRARAVEEADLVAAMTGAYLCFCGLDRKNEEGEPEAASVALMEEIARIRPYQDKLFLLAEKTVHYQMDRIMLDLVIEPASPAERVALFEYYLRDVPIQEEVSARELAAKFRFEPLQIKQAAEQADGLRRLRGQKKLDNETIHRCCYRQVVHNLDKLASRITPCFSWDDVVLPKPQKVLMQQACAHVQFQHKVYHDWGFAQKISYGKGLSILFAGAPGTGKTMCAQIIAKQLNMEMYKINISQIVSKYIGETEKNLHTVFREARNSNCILFFDECDALFGKRSEVKDAHDRNANVEVAYLLQQIEEHDGVCILASNLVQNIDAAFMRRITYVVHFPFPDPPMRQEIYRRMLPARAPVDDNIDWEFIAGKFDLSGGHIKNIVLSAAFVAAAEDKPIGMKHLLMAAVNELRKNEIVVVREELREYADMIFDD